MRIGCLQFAPQVGDVDNNLNRADSVLNRADPRDLEDLDLLVLPEMAFTGYNFKSLQEIMPYLEPQGSGISALWARTTALKYDCKVAVGYPEKVNSSTNWTPTSQYYNSLLLVNEDGETLANYRKQHLYYTDETWSAEGTGGFFQGEVDGLGQTAMGICMDINPYRFEAPWHQFEFAFHVLESHANVVIISMAWSTLEHRAAFCSKPYEPDMDTLEYWATRMEPLIRAEREDEIIIVFANRCGIEGDSLYAGSSAVMGVKNGEVNVYGVLGRGTKHLLVVDTENGPFAKLVSRPGRDAAAGEWDGTTADAEDEVNDSKSPVDDDGDNFMDIHNILDPVGYRPTAPVQTPMVEATMHACVPEVPEESDGTAKEAIAQPAELPKMPKESERIAEENIAEYAKPAEVPEAFEVIAEPAKPAEGTANNLAQDDDMSDWMMQVDERLPSTDSLAGEARADSPIMTPTRPRLTISTTTSPVTPINTIPPSSDLIAHPVAPPRDLVTPPPTGEFPDQEYLAAAAQVKHILFSAVSLHTPDEPSWPLPEITATPQSASQSPFEFKPLPLLPPLDGDKPLPLRPQEKLLVAKSSFAVSVPQRPQEIFAPANPEFLIPLPLSPSPEEVPLPESSPDSETMPGVVVRSPSTVVWAPESMQVIEFGDMPLAKPPRINFEHQRKDSGISEALISIEVEGCNKETVVVQLRDQAPLPLPSRSVTITFSIGTAL